MKIKKIAIKKLLVIAFCGLLVLVVWDAIWLADIKSNADKLVGQITSSKTIITQKKWDQANSNIETLDSLLEDVLKANQRLIFFANVNTVKKQIDKIKLVKAILDENKDLLSRVINNISDNEDYEKWENDKRIELWTDITKISENLKKYSLNLRKTDIIDFDITPTLELIALSPDLIGANSKTNILILFQNETEIRPTGGFWGAIGELELTNGLASTSNSFSISEINKNVDDISIVPDDIKNIIHSSTKLPVEIQFINSISDFSKVIETFQPVIEEHRQKKYDLAIAVDLYSMSKLLEQIGEIDIQNIGKINSQNIIDELVYNPYQKNVSNQYREDRKDAIGTVGTLLVNKIFSGDPVKTVSWFSKMTDERHLLLTSQKPKIKIATDRLNLSNEFNPSGNNYILYEETNFGGKQSLMLERKKNIEQIDKGRYRVSFSYKYLDSEKARGFELSQNKTLVRIRVPSDAILLKSTGYQDGANEVNVQGDRAFSNILIINPGEKKELVFEYELPESARSDDASFPEFSTQPGIEF